MAFFLRVTHCPRFRGLELAWRYTELEHLGECSGETRGCVSGRDEDEESKHALLEPERFVVSVRLGPFLEALVLCKNVVRSGKDV